MTTITHRGWNIEQAEYGRHFIATNGNYEPIWLGEGEGWIDGERFEADTVEAAIEEIDIIEDEWIGIRSTALAAYAASRNAISKGK